MGAAKQWRVSVGSEVRVVGADQAIEVAGEMFAKHGVQPKVEPLGDAESAPANDSAPRAKALAMSTSIVAPSQAMAEPLYSEFGVGNQIVDDAAKTRIEAMHESLKAGGVNVDASRQLYATGTRMARVGYDNQQRRADEHAEKLSFNEAAEKLVNRVRNEKREDIEVSAAEFGREIKANGKVTAFGLRVSEQAMRGLCARIESPSLRYLLGLRDRVAASKSEIARLEALPVEDRGGDEEARAKFLFESMRADRAKIADVIRHECVRNPDVTLKMRARQGVGDIFAIVSPGYTPADAPEVVDQIAHKLPEDARGSFAYDPTSTAWELRANVWTKTPVAEQAVGEPFEGYASFQGRDNGTARFKGGGGIVLLACLNASTYTAEGENVSRVHRSNVLVDVDHMLKVALKSIDTLTGAWGQNREENLCAEDASGWRPGMTIEDVIPGFWRYLLTDRRSELVGVLPGRSEHHVKQLSEAYFDQRRDQDRVVRADLAQGWTRYVQSQPTPVRRAAEAAIGDWLVSDKRVGVDLRDDE